jgi:Reverse transcriptase (RNA-dependent DNA polymerase).
MKSMVSTNKIPPALKKSRITPLYKKGTVDNIGNYRPIGSMCFLEKILEKYLKNNIKKYLEENQIIPSLQYGFQAKNLV